MRFKLNLIASVVAIVLGVCVPNPLSAQAVQPTGALIPELMGRWDVSFRSAQANLDTVWVVEPSVQNATSIGTVGPNPVAILIATAALDNASVTLGGSTSLGALALAGRLDGDRLAGDFTAGPVRGTFVATRRAVVRTQPLTTLFDEAVSAFEKKLFTPAPFDAAWQARRAELRAQLESPTATERDMVRSVRVLIAAAQLSHNSYYIPGAAPADVEPTRTGPSVTWRRLDDDLGYIGIDYFVEDPAERERIDAAFADLAGTKGLVIDLRGNSGGNLGLAMRLGDHLLSAGSRAGLFATRRGLDAAGVQSMDQLPASAYREFDGYSVDQYQALLAETGGVALVTGGRAPAYAGQVALLIDGESGSASEAMAAVLKESGRARLFGTRTAGAMLSSQTFPMTDGYVLRVAFADFRTPGGAVAERVGVMPHQTVGGDGEAVLSAATRWLAQQR